MYDLSGVLQTKLGGTEFGEDDSLGSVTAVVETANGYMALDGNMRTVRSGRRMVRLSAARRIPICSAPAIPG